MRQIGTLGDLDTARRFVAVLSGRGIRSEIRSEPAGGAAVWVLDEDRLGTARDVLAEFKADPTAERFRIIETPEVSKRPEPEPRKATPGIVAGALLRQVPVTAGLIAISVLVGILTGLREGATEAGSWLSIAPFRVLGGGAADWVPELGLSAIRSGEVWRLVTPIFVHYGPVHLLMNMMWVWTLGGPIERRLGSLKLLLIVFAVAVASNLSEYWLDFGFDFGMKQGFKADIGIDPAPWFGGMSGVVFGLFGLIWMRARLQPSFGFRMPRDMVVWMLMWLLVCTTGLIGPVANVAHGTGLLAGMVIGAAPRLWRRG